MRAITAALLMTTTLMLTCAGADDQAWRVTPSAQSPIPCLPKATCLAIADFNRDGRPDIAAVNRDPGDVLILLNAGGGRFAQPSTDGRILVGSTANGVAVADIDRDQSPDLLVCFHDSDSITVLRGRGDGRFDAARMQPIMTRERGAPHVHSIAIADLNRDDHLDVIMNQADDNEIAWALGKSDGTFAPVAPRFPAGNHPYTVVVADFNNDGHLDFASPNALSDDLTVGLGDGAGGFAAPTSPAVRLARGTLGLAAGDVNGDGHADLVTNSDQEQRTLTLLLGDGKGGFTRSPQAFEAPARCYGQAITDIDGDGLRDVVAPCIDRGSVIVWLARDPASLRFERMEFDTPGTDSQVMELADVNGDGVRDMVTAGWQQATLTVLLGSRP